MAAGLDRVLRGAILLTAALLGACGGGGGGSSGALVPTSGDPTVPESKPPVVPVEGPFVFRHEAQRLQALQQSGNPRAQDFLSRMVSAAAARQANASIPSWYLALAGWQLDNDDLLRLAHDEAMAIVQASPGGDSGRGTPFKDVDHRLLEVAGVVDLAGAMFTSAERSRVAAWVNGTLDNWNAQNTSFWPFDDPFNNYWQNGFLAHVLAAVATQAYNPRADEWKQKAAAMFETFRQASEDWSGPIQAEGNYYSAYVTKALWAMQLHDAAMGTTWMQDSRFDVARYLRFLRFQLRSGNEFFFHVGSQPNQAEAPFTFIVLWYWQHLIHSCPDRQEAAHAKALLDPVLDKTLAMSRADKAFIRYFWNTDSITPSALTALTDRFLAEYTPGAGLIGLRSQAGFQTQARAALLFANTNGSGGRPEEASRWSHANPDAPGFQWTEGGNWLVTDPDFYSRSGISAEAGSADLSDLSNIVTLAGVKDNASSGGFPLIRYAENNTSAAVPHFYAQIDAQPYWNMASTYRREYVWLDDLQVVVVRDRVVAAPSKTWRLHVPAQPQISGDTATYTVGGRTVRVRDLSRNGAWSQQNLNGTGPFVADVWRLSQQSDVASYDSVKLLDVGGRVESASSARNGNAVQVDLRIAGSDRTIRFFDNGAHVSVQ